MTKTVVFIHGAWLTPAAWDLFRARYEAQGFTCIAPPWPYGDQPIDDLRRSPHPSLRKLTITKIVEHYAKIIRALPEPPIIMGHSVGGLVTQLLLDRKLGAAGVALSTATVRGILPRPRALLCALPVFMAWNGWNRVLRMSLTHFSQNFANALPRNDLLTAFSRYIVATPGRIYWQAALGIGTRIDADNLYRAPLLLIAGEDDRTIVPSMVEASYKLQKAARGITTLKSFPGRSHMLFAEPGWEEIADFALEWATRHARITFSDPAPEEAERALASAA